MLCGFEQGYTIFLTEFPYLYTGGQGVEPKVLSYSRFTYDQCSEHKKHLASFLILPRTRHFLESVNCSYVISSKVLVSISSNIAFPSPFPMRTPDKCMLGFLAFSLPSPCLATSPAFIYFFI